MICERTIKDYCCEDPHLIENYNEAINDKTQTWDCHHRLEIDLDKTAKELEELGLYWNRPASELIFLTSSEHSKLHTIGKNNPLYGSCLSEEHKQKLSEAQKDKPKPKFKWLTPAGEIKIMGMANANCWHPDWIKIGEV